MRKKTAIMMTIFGVLVIALGAAAIVYGPGLFEAKAGSDSTEAEAPDAGNEPKGHLGIGVI